MQRKPADHFTAFDLPPLDPLQRYTIPEAAAYLRISRAKLYQDMKSGAVPVVKDGSRTFVPGHVIADRSRVQAA
jgi:excisionase family DNA binding protein